MAYYVSHGTLNPDCLVTCGQAKPICASVVILRLNTRLLRLFALKLCDKCCCSKCALLLCRKRLHLNNASTPIHCMTAASLKTPTTATMRNWRFWYFRFNVAYSFHKANTVYCSSNEVHFCSVTHTHTHLFNGPFQGLPGWAGTRKVTNLDFTEARDSEWQWHQVDHMQVCTSLQTENHASTPPLSFFKGRMPFLPPNQQHQSTEAHQISK